MERRRLRRRAARSRRIAPKPRAAGAASRLRPRRHCRLRAARRGPAARLAGELRVRRSACAATRRRTTFRSSSSTRAATTSGGSASAELRVSARLAARSGSSSARSTSPGGRPRTARCGARRRSSSWSRPVVAAARARSGSSGSSCASCRRSRRRCRRRPCRRSSSSAGADARAGDRRRRRRPPGSSDAGAGAAQSSRVDFGEPREFGGLIAALARGRARVALRRRVLGRRRALAHGAPRSTGAQRRHRRASGCPKPRRASAPRPARRAGRRRTRSPSSRCRTSPSARRRTPSSRRSRASAPRGTYPRGYLGEQSYWTLVGVDGGGESGAAVGGRRARGRAAAASRSSRSCVGDARVVGWADVEPRSRCVDGDLPMPGVHLAAAAAGRCASPAFASGRPRRGRGSSRATTLRNLDAIGRCRSTLVLAVRPFQVNPPAQFLTRAGGVERDPRHRVGRRRARGQRQPQGLPADAARRASGTFPFDAGPVAATARDARLDGPSRGPRRARLRLGGARATASTLPPRGRTTRRRRRAALGAGDRTPISSGEAGDGVARRASSAGVAARVARASSSRVAIDVPAAGRPRSPTRCAPPSRTS